MRGQGVLVLFSLSRVDKLFDSVGKSRKLKARAQRRRPRTMMGMERRRMRRRPMRSM